MGTPSPFIQQIVGSLVRMAIVWLSAKFGATLSDDELVKLTAEIVPILLVVGWSVYQKYRNRQKLMTAQVMSGGVTEHQVEAAVDAGAAPSVFTAKDRIPA